VSAELTEKPSPLGRGDRIAVGEVDLIRPRVCSAIFPKGEGLVRQGMKKEKLRRKE